MDVGGKCVCRLHGEGANIVIPAVATEDPASLKDDYCRAQIEIGSVMQLSDKRDAALPALASPPQCRSGNPLSEPVRKGLAGLVSDAGAIG
jgi:hypothetical protein